MGGYGTWVYLVVIIGLMYFIMIRPQQKQNKTRQQMLSNMSKGDRVITAGGIHGKITSMKDDTVNVEIARNIVITVQKSGIASIQDEDDVNTKDSTVKEENSEDDTKVEENK